MPDGKPLAEREGWVEFLTQTFLAWVAVLILAALICLLVALLFLFAAKPSLAQFVVPQACIDLAKSFGRSLPPELGRFKYERAKAELKLLSDADPAVKACRAALAKMEGKK